MAGEQDLGTAVLRLEVRTDQALSAINAFRNEVVRALGGVGDNIFDGIEQQGRNAGQRTGRALADGVRRATQGLRFENIEEALNFTGALNGTLRDLRTYREALVSLREVTPATAQGFAQLNDVIAATGQAIRNYSASTDQLVDDAVRVAIREQAAALREQRDAVRDAAREDRSWAEALRTIEQAQRSAAAATRIANQAFRDQAAAIGSIAQKGASDVAGTVRGVGKGIGAVAKGAVGLGKGVYNLGAEFGVFEEPKTGPIKQSIQQVIDRFKFLGEQAQTTRGQILRSIEAIGTGAGLVEIARNAELLKAALGGVDGAAQVAGKGLGLLDKVGGGFFNFLANRFPDTAFGEFAKLGAGATEVAAGIGSATSSLTNFATQGLSASLDGLQAFIGALSNVPPEAQAAVLALAGISLGFKEKPIVEGLTRVLEYLDGLSGKALKVRGDLSSVLNDLTQFQDKLAAANDQKLLPAFRDRGLTQLDDSVRQGESYRRITDAIAGNWERGARYLEKSNAELRRLVQQGLLLRPLSGSPVVPGGNLLPPGAPASSLPNSQQYAGPIGPEPSLEFLQGKANQAAAALKALQDAAQALAARQDAQARAIGEFGASPVTGRLAGGGAIPGSPASREDRFRRGQEILAQEQARLADEEARRAAQRSGIGKRVSGALGSGLIGGAFPALFGQGIGASVGGGVLGGVGGAIGGQFGFGLSLVGTAVGQAFDQMIEKGRTLASALQDPIANFNTLKEAGLISSKSLERTVAGLIETGRQAEATALLQKDLARFGGTAELKALNDAFDGATKAFSELGVAVAQFTAGPLTDFLTKLQGAIRLPVLAAQFDAQVGQLSPEQQKRQRELLKADFQKFAIGTGLSQGEAGVKAYQERLKAIKEIVGKTAEERIAEDNLLRARKLYNDQIALSKNLIDAKYKGDEREINALERKKILLDLANKTFGLSAQDPRVQKANQDASDALYENAKQLEKIDAQRWANNIASANKLRSIQEQSAIEAARPNLTGIGTGVLQSLAAVREARRTLQNAQAQSRVSPGDPSLLNAAKEASDALKAAGTKLKSDLQEAFKSAQDAVRGLTRSFEDGRLALAELQNTSGQGVNRYLNAQQVRQRQELLNPGLVAKAQRAIGNFEASTGIKVPIQSVTGTLEQRNAQLIDIARVFDNENRAVEDLNLTNLELIKASNSLAIATAALDVTNTKVADALVLNAQTTSKLIDKNWEVNVNVQSPPAFIPSPG